MAKLGIKSNLLRSALVVSIFWMLLGISFYSLIPVNKMTEYFDLIGYLPEIDIFITNQFELINLSLSYRLVQSSPYLVGGILFGVIALLLYFIVSYLTRGRRSKKDSYEGMFCKIAPLPRSQVYDVKGVNSIIKSKRKQNQPLLNELVAFARAHKNHFIGHAHGDTGLYKHTLSVIKKAHDFEGAHYLLEIAAAAHDLGKIMTFDGDQPNNKYHDVEGGEILKRMSKLETLTHNEQMMLIMAVTFQHHRDRAPLSIPSLSSEEYASFQELLSQLISIDGTVTSEEKQTSIEAKSVDIDDCLYDAFTQLVKTASFYSASSGRKSSNIGYRWGNRLYLFEYLVREFLMSEVPEVISKQLDLDISSAKRVSDGMRRFMRLMNDKGLLVFKAKTANGDVYEMHPEGAFWDVKSGDYNFKAMIVVEINNELKAHFPPESAYPVEIKSPYKMSNAKKIASDSVKKESKDEAGSNQIDTEARSFSSARKSRNISMADVDEDNSSSRMDANDIISMIDEIELNSEGAADVVLDPPAIESKDKKDQAKPKGNKVKPQRKTGKAMSGDSSKETKKSKSGNDLPPNLF